MRKLLLFFVLVLFISSNVQAQFEFERIGAGLSFATKKRFNNGDTGNPGLNVKTWIAIDQRKTFHIVPSVTAYNTLESSHTTYITTNYMFQGDLDVQYLLFHEKTLKLVTFVGFNYTHILSKNFILQAVPNLIVTDDQWSGFGPNVGGALEMRMGSSVDFIASIKYKAAGLQRGDPDLDQWFLIAPLGSPVVQIHAVYYFTNRGKGYSRR